jgi:hypothetical protein
MDLKTLLPDFNAIGKTDWSKPNFDTKSMNLLSFLGAVLMVAFVFFSWTKIVDVDSSEYTKLGVTTWFGILGLVMAIGALVGVLYNHNSLTFSCAALAIVFGIIGIMVIPEMEIEGVTYTADEIKEIVKNSKEYKAQGLTNKVVEISHLGAILFTVASAVTAFGAFIKINKK